MKKSSWHYRYNSFVSGIEGLPFIDNTRMVNLCPYFWSTIFNLSWGVVFVSTFYMLFTFLGMVTTEVFKFLPYTENTIDLTFLWIYGVGFIGMIFGLVVLSVTLIDKIRDWKWEAKYYVSNKFPKVVAFKVEKSEKGKKNLGLFTQWYNAKKDKFCPRIEWED